MSKSTKSASNFEVVTILMGLHDQTKADTDGSARLACHWAAMGGTTLCHVMTTRTRCDTARTLGPSLAPHTRKYNFSLAISSDGNKYIDIFSNQGKDGESLSNAMDVEGILVAFIYSNWLRAH